MAASGGKWLFAEPIAVDDVVERVGGYQQPLLGTISSTCTAVAATVIERVSIECWTAVDGPAAGGGADTWAG